MKFSGLSIGGSQFYKLQPAGNIACPAGSNTTVATIPTTVVTHTGKYWIQAVAAIWIQFGAALPTALQFTLNYTGGNDTHIVEPTWLSAQVVNSTIVIPMVQLIDATLIQPFGGSNVNYQCQPTTNAVTVMRSATGTGTQIAIGIFRWPD